MSEEKEKESEVCVVEMANINADDAKSILTVVSDFVEEKNNMEFATAMVVMSMDVVVWVIKHNANPEKLREKLEQVWARGDMPWNQQTVAE